MDEKIPAPKTPEIGDEAEVELLTLATPPEAGLVDDGETVGVAVGDEVGTDRIETGAGDTVGATLLLSDKDVMNNLLCSIEVGTLISVADSLTPDGAGDTLGALVVSAASEVRNRPWVVSSDSLTMEGAGDTVGAFVTATTSANMEPNKRNKILICFIM